MATVLISGSPGRVDDVSAAMEAQGWECVVAHDMDGLRRAVDGLDEPVDAYVQLPVAITSDAPSAIGQIRDLLTEGLVARFDAAQSAVGRLRDGGSVVLVAGNTPGDQQLNDDQRARASLLRVLSHCILADAGTRGVRSVVLGSNASPDDVAATAAGKGKSTAEAIADFVSEADDVSYADWRLELLSMVSNES